MTSTGIKKIHSIEPLFNGDALHSMLKNVLNCNVDFNLNHQRSLIQVKYAIG